MKEKITGLEDEITELKSKLTEAHQLKGVKLKLKEEKKEYALLKSDFQKLQTQHEIQKVDLGNRNQQIQLLETQLEAESARAGQLEQVNEKVKTELGTIG